MGWVTIARRRHVNLAWVGFGVSDELRKCLSRKRCVHQHNVGLADNARDRRDVANEIETEPLIKRCGGCILGRGQEECVAVCNLAVILPMSGRKLLSTIVGIRCTDKAPVTFRSSGAQRASSCTSS